MSIFVISPMSLASLRHSDKRQPLRPLTKQGDFIAHRSHELSPCCRVDVSERDKLGAVGVAKAQQEMKVKCYLPIGSNQDGITYCHRYKLLKQKKIRP